MGSGVRGFEPTPVGDAGVLLCVMVLVYTTEDWISTLNTNNCSSNHGR